MSITAQNQAQFNPIRRSAMHHKHLLLGALMVERDGWQQPAHFGSAEAEAKHLREALGICDISPRAKFVIKGDQAEQLVSRVFPTALIPDVGEIIVEAHAGGIHGANAALCRLAQDEIIRVATTGLATWLADGLKDDSGQCVHSPDISSALAGVSIAGPQASHLLAMISELNTSDAAFPNLRCAQSKFADIHGTLLRIDLGNLPNYQLYFGREFGEYMWDALVEAAEVCGGAPVGFEAMDQLQG